MRDRGREHVQSRWRGSGVCGACGGCRGGVGGCTIAVMCINSRRTLTARSHQKVTACRQPDPGFRTPTPAGQLASRGAPADGRMRRSYPWLCVLVERCRRQLGNDHNVLYQAVCGPFCCPPLARSHGAARLARKHYICASLQRSSSYICCRLFSWPILSGCQLATSHRGVAHRVFHAITCQVKSSGP